MEKLLLKRRSRSRSYKKRALERDSWALVVVSPISRIHDMFGVGTRRGALVGK